MTKRGRYIAVEGLEGAGKSTAIDTIKLGLVEVAPELVLTREPGGTRVGEQIRSILTEHLEGEKLSDRAELLLFYAARVQLVEEVIKPALARGAWVLADRFELSSFAYQGFGRGLDIEVIQQISSFCLQGFQPDLIFYLDIDPQQGLDRVKKRGKTDRIEEESLPFFEKIRQGYHSMIQSMNDRVVPIDAGQGLESVQKLLLTHLQDFIDKNAKS